MYINCTCKLQKLQFAIHFRKKWNKNLKIPKMFCFVYFSFLTEKNISFKNVPNKSNIMYILHYAKLIKKNIKNLQNRNC